MNRPTRILHLCKSFLPESYGGVEQAVLELCRGANDAGFHAEVFTLHRGTRRTEILEVEGIRVTRVGIDLEIASTPFSRRAIVEFRRLQRKFDIIQLHFPWPFGDLLYLTCGLGKKLVVTYHSDIVKQRFLKHIYKPVMIALLRKATVIVATSDNYLHSSLPLRPFRNKTLAIPLGLDESKYPKANRSIVRELQRSWGGFYFCFVGVLRYYKGLTVLIEAAPLVDATIVVVGDGPQMRVLKSLAQDCGARNIVFLGAVSEQAKVDVLTGSSGFVFPSSQRSEAFGLGLVEASMFGKPMVSCEIGTGTSFINIHEVTGLVVSASAPQSLADALNALKNNPGLAAQYGRSARARFEELFTCARMTVRYRQLYQTMLQERR